jgi:hypothetical protein
MSDWSYPDECIWSWVPLFAVFFVCVLLSIPTRPKFLFLVTSPTCLCAWVVVLAHNYKKKVPVPTFVGLVEYEKQPIFYQSLFGVLLLMGCFVALCTFLLQGSRSLDVGGQIPTFR